MEAKAMDYEDLVEFLCAYQGDPHCYSAHVPGQGYVNRGDNPVTRADFDRQWARSKRIEAENMRWAEGYAEPGYDQPKLGVLFANWNVFPSDAGDDLETLGYSLEWSDEWAICEDCNRAFRTEPDSFCWEPSGHYDDDGPHCNACSSEAAMRDLGMRRTPYGWE